MKLMIIDKNEIEVPLLEAENSGRGAFLLGEYLLVRVPQHKSCPSTLLILSFFRI